MHKAIAGTIVALIIAFVGVPGAHAAPLRGAAIGDAGFAGSALIPVWHWGVPHKTICRRSWRQRGRIVCRQQLGSPGGPALRDSKRIFIPRNLPR